MASSSKSDSSVFGFLKKLFEPRADAPYLLKDVDMPDGGVSSMKHKGLVDDIEADSEDGWTTASSSTASDSGNEVICEIPVYLSKHVGEQLYALKYQTTARWVDQHKVTGFCVRPKQQQVRVDIAIDTNDKQHYDQHRAAKIAANVDGNDPTNRNLNPVFPSGRVDKMSFKSKECLLDSNYCAGVFLDGELHLSPVKGIFDMRPDFSHLDQADELQKKAVSEQLDSAESSEESKEPKLTAVNVRISKVRGKVGRQKHIQHHQMVNEPWMNLQYNDIQSEQSLAAWTKLFCTQSAAHKSDPDGTSLSGGDPMEVDGVSSELTALSKEQYLESLLPQPWKDDTTHLPATNQAKVDDFVTLTQLKDKPIPEQIYHLMRKANVITFQMLMQNLPPKTDQGLVLSELEKIAVLVQGCWAIHSGLIYKDDCNIPLTGASNDQLIDGRDYVLWKFSLGKSVKRKDISAAIKLPHDHVMHILQPIAKCQSNYGWKFNLDCDPAFTEAHPDIVLQQQLLWQVRYQLLCSKHKIAKVDHYPVSAEQQLVAAGSSGFPVKERHHSGSKASSGRSPVRVRKRSTSSVTGGSGRRDGESGGHHQVNLAEIQEELEGCVTDYTLAQGKVVSVRRLKAHVISTMSRTYGDKHPLVVGTSEMLVRLVLGRMLYVQMDEKWVKPPASPRDDVYALSATGDADIDNYIQPLLAAFTQSGASIKLGELKAGVRKHLQGLQPDDGLLHHVLSMYCTLSKTAATFKCS